MRLDALLVERGLVGSRSLARRLIEAGVVSLRESGQLRTLSRPADEFGPDAELVVAESALTRYVSRGGLKLEAAMRAAQVSAAGLDCLDIGQSTGGFTDCLLKHGARSVTGVDVGHGQLTMSLRTDPRVRCLEGVNIRTLTPEQLAAAQSPTVFALIVIDVSFISLAHVLNRAAHLGSPAATLLALIKPQFEVGAARVGKGGIVRSANIHREVIERVSGYAHEAGWTVLATVPSELLGGDGNREFFLHARL